MGLKGIKGQPGTPTTNFLKGDKGERGSPGPTAIPPKQESLSILLRNIWHFNIHYEILNHYFSSDEQLPIVKIIGLVGSVGEQGFAGDIGEPGIIVSSFN